MQNERLAQYTPVQVTLGDKTVRAAHVLADRGETLIVEYLGPKGYRNKIVKRFQVEEAR